MKVRFSCILVVFLALLILVRSLGAQWKIVAPNLASQANEFGAMQYRNGTVWAGGVMSLWYSNDLGATWHQNTSFPGSKIKDIAFFNTRIGLVACDNEVYLTTDGGSTWIASLTGFDLRKVGFGLSSSVMYAVDYNNSFYTSSNGGQRWTSTIIGIDARSFAVAQNGTIYLQSTISQGSADPLGTVVASSDEGRTWSSGGATFNFDCYSLSVDSCDAAHLCLVNEEVNASSGVGNVYISPDGGATWQLTGSHAQPYYSGALTTNRDAVVLGTLDGSGELRSTDRGATWNSIGGPQMDFDDRNLAILNDNTILATDDNGSIWLTTNGGGDSVAYSGPFDGTIAFSADSLFQGDTLECDSATLPLYVRDSGCHPPLPQQYTITGPDAGSFRVIDQAEDSLVVEFLPGHAGPLRATLVAKLADGSDSSIVLAGFSAPPETLAFDATSLNVKTDTIGGDVWVPIRIDGLSRPEEVELVLHYPLADLVYDGSFDRSGNAVDIPGEAWPGRSKLRIVDDTPGTVAAYAHFNVFSDTDYHPQVSFDSVTIPSELSPCSYSVPPAATATIYPLEGCGDQLLSRWVHLGELPLLRVQPNPSNGDISISTTQDLGTATIEVTDALGTLRARFECTLSKSAPMQLSLPVESGVYYLRVISGLEHGSVPFVIAK